jgi:hypothetical protein
MPPTNPDTALLLVEDLTPGRFFVAALSAPKIYGKDLWHHYVDPILQQVAAQRGDERLRREMRQKLLRHPEVPPIPSPDFVEEEVPAPGFPNLCHEYGLKPRSFPREYGSSTPDEEGA